MEALGGNPVGSATRPPAALTPSVQLAPTQSGTRPTVGAPGAETATTVTVAPTVMQTTTSIALPPPIQIPELPVQSSEELWREQQQSRQVFAEPRNYRTGTSNLWWYDPINSQHVVLGVISGDFAAQAEFVLEATGEQALEIPYRINQSYDLTALSPAIIERLGAAGYTEWVETYVLLDSGVVQQ
ncbi:MAG: hypothetical protein HC822_04430 [Oscillochloris sp.]|nr:hypothetical protein [Oscillochloris sp.]